MSLSTESILGAFVVAGGGLLSGSGAWPMKLMKRYQFEHWWFVAMLIGLIVVPWTVVLVYCPNALSVYSSIPWKTLLTANLWSIGWGIANVLCGICYVRLGLALTTAIMTGLGVAIGVTLPMLVKGTGLFKNASDPTTPAGLVLLSGVGVMVLAVVIVSFAGAGRDQARQKADTGSGKFVGALLMAVSAGVLTCGMSLSFVYGQGPIMASMKQEGSGEVPAIFAVWAVCLLGGAIPSVVYPGWLMTRKRSWGVFTESWNEMALAAIIGINVAASVALLGIGMLMLGSLGASVGIGIQQATWMLGGQAVGFLSGEWRGVDGRPRKLLCSAILLLIIAMLVMIYGNTLVKT